MAQIALEDIQRAVIKAHNSGDIDGAKRLADIYKRQSAQMGPGPTEVQPQQQEVVPEGSGPFENFTGALQYGADTALERLGTTATMLGAEDTGQALQGAMQSPENYVSAAQQFTQGDPDGSFAWRYLPKAAVEVVPQFAGALASRAVGATAGGLVAGPGGAVVGGLAGPAIFEAMQLLGPVAKERAMNQGRQEPNMDDWKWSMGTSAGSGILNTIAPGSSGILRRTILETLTEGTQSVIEQAGTTAQTNVGLQIDEREALAEGIIGGTAAGGVTATTSLIPGVRNQTPEEANNEDAQARASFANTLTRVANANNFNLKNVNPNSKKGAKQALEVAHEQLTGELKEIKNDLKPKIKVTDKDGYENLMNKVLADTAFRQGKNKVKSMVGSEEFSALEELAGDTFEGQRARQIMLELNELTGIFNTGLKGGLSQYTDRFGIIGNSGNYNPLMSGLESVVRPTSAIGLGSINPMIPVGMAAVQGTGRAVDALTGRRSIVKRYVEQNKNKPTLMESTAPSLRAKAKRESDEADILKAAQAKKKAEKDAARKAARRESYDNNIQMTNPDDPQFIIQDALGVEDVQAFKVILQEALDSPNVGDGTKFIINELNALMMGDSYGISSYAIIPNLRNFLDVQRPDLMEQFNLDPNDRDKKTLAAKGVTAEVSGAEANIQRGIQENREFLDSLREAVNAEDIPPIAKVKLLGALDKLGENLGIDPLARVSTIRQDLADANVDEELIVTFVDPYIDRVVTQQANKPTIKPIPSVEPVKKNEVTPEEIKKAERKREIQALRDQANLERFGTPQGVDTSYRMDHQPREDGARLDDMTGGGEYFPDDIYSPNGLRFYGNPNNKFDRESFKVIQESRGKPEKEVTIYRAVPKGIKTINVGDFVTLSKTYAEDHAFSGYGISGQDSGEVISKNVKVKDLVSDGNDLNEFGYYPTN